MIHVTASTPFKGWENVDISATHDGTKVSDFSTTVSLVAEEVGRYCT
jgi:hypothetical protein